MTSFEIQNTIQEPTKTLRCAIYTRKSNSQGLEQEFTSLDAQRDVGAAFVDSQKFQGWTVSPKRYDDGGYSGGNTNRPGLQELLKDIDEGNIDVIVLYKFDRISRSLLDFVLMVEKFKKLGVSVVSVTEQINTSTPVGIAFLNILMTFAQLEREVAGERIRHKLEASKRRGKYIEGIPVLGYNIDSDKKKLLVNKDEAKTVNHIFKRFHQLGSVKNLAKELNEQGYRTKKWITKSGNTKGGLPWKTTNMYRLLHNKLYIGLIGHKGQYFNGEHDAIIDPKLWKKTQDTFAKKGKEGTVRINAISPLRGVMRCGHCDSSMRMTYTQKKGKRYCYYICDKDSKRAVSTCPVQRFPAGDIEKAIINQLGSVFRTPTLIAQTHQKIVDLKFNEKQRLLQQQEIMTNLVVSIREEAIELMKDDDSINRSAEILDKNQEMSSLTAKLEIIKKGIAAIDAVSMKESDIACSFDNMDTFWDVLYPAEQQRLIILLVEIIEVRETGLDMILNTAEMDNLITELAYITHDVKERNV